MTGNFEHKVDAKGRLFIPSTLRSELGEVFHVTISTEDCLNAYSNESWERFLDNVKSLPLSQQHKMRPFFSNASRCELDSQGRFLLSQKLRDRIGLVKDATVVGAGPFAQIWNTETFKRVDELETTTENLIEVMDMLNF